jgi:hypothetical protein
MMLRVEFHNFPLKREYFYHAVWVDLCKSAASIDGLGVDVWEFLNMWKEMYISLFLHDAFLKNR